MTRKQLCLKAIYRIPVMFILCVVACGFAFGKPSKPRLTSFDVPGAGTCEGCGTVPLTITAQGVIAGYYVDNKGFSHGFIRGEDGKIVTYNAPNSLETQIWSMTAGGLFTGSYSDASGNWHGFVASTRGYFVSFDPADSVFTFSDNINPQGETAGYYYDADGLLHAFLRTAAAHITTFDAAADASQTFPASVCGLNQAGLLAGGVQTTVEHGWLRTRDGTITLYDVSGTVDTDPACMNAGGTIAGAYTDEARARHGYIRAADGTITRFDAPGAGTGQFEGTAPEGINAGGVVSGFVADSNDVGHGFVRYPSGRIVIFDAPGGGTGFFQGTFAGQLNSAGKIAAQYIDSNDVSHGLLVSLP